jgi:methylthioxylose transferase
LPQTRLCSEVHRYVVVMTVTVAADDVAIQNASPGSVPQSARVAMLLPLCCWLALIAVTAVWGRYLSGEGVGLGIGAAPLAGRFGWRVSGDALIPVAFGAGVVWFGPRVAAQLAWPRLLAAVSAVSAGWALALSRIDGPGAFTSPFRAPAYLQVANQISDPHAFLSEFVQRIHSYNSHVRGHPPGMTVLLWATGRIGLSSVEWTAVLALVGGAAAGVAALVALRDVADEGHARAAAPFVALAPAAIWWSSGDAFFAGVAAWAVTLVVLATRGTGSRSDRRSALGGFLFGVTAFLSYGLVLLACIPIGVAASRRRLRPLVLAAVGAAPVFVAFRAAGFSWLAGLAATRTQYWLGAASGRPYRYFVVADLAAFALAVGPAAAVAIARLRSRRVWLLVGGALVGIVVADLSAMSKAEVERIWLPFVPWVLLATSALAARTSGKGARVLLGLQAASAVLIELAVRSPW